jgi:hypothetical protein
LQVLADGSITYSDGSGIGQFQQNLPDRILGLPEVGRWKKVGKRHYKASMASLFTKLSDGSLLYRIKGDLDVKLSRDGKSYSGSITGSFYPIDDIDFSGEPLFALGTPQNGVKLPF